MHDGLHAERRVLFVSGPVLQRVVLRRPLPEQLHAGRRLLLVPVPVLQLLLLWGRLLLIEPFLMERMQSQWENRVSDWNLDPDLKVL